MERIKAPVVRVMQKAPARIKPNQAPKRIKPGGDKLKHSIDKKVVIPSERIYNGGMVKDQKTGMYWKDGEYYKKVDGCYLKCWPNGFLKDQKTPTHVCWFGRVHRRSTEEELRKASIAVITAMVKSFPEDYYDENGNRISQVDEDGCMIYKRKLI